MNPDTDPPRRGSARLRRRWIEEWEPEDGGFWETKGKSIALHTLAITTANLMMAFAVWFVVSALVVRLDKVGFDLSTTQLFWLAAMPGLAGGTFRILHTFLVPVFGTRDRREPLDRVAAPSPRRLVLRRSEPRHAVLGVPRPRVPRRARRRQLLLVHAVDEPLLPEAAAGHRARDPGRDRQLRRQPRPVPDAVGDRVRARRQRPGDRQGRGRLAPERRADLDPVRRLLRRPRLAPAPQRARAGERARADRHLPRQAHVDDDVAVRDDLRLVRGLRGDVPADDQGGLRWVRRRARSAHVRVPRAARRLDRAGRGRPARGPLRRRPADPGLGDRPARVRRSASRSSCSPSRRTTSSGSC